MIYYDQRNYLACQLPLDLLSLPQVPGARSALINIAVFYTVVLIIKTATRDVCFIM